MRIRIGEEEYQIGSLKAKGNTIVNGRAISWNGILAEGVEDITQYKTVLVDGVKTKVEVVPKIYGSLERWAYDSAGDIIGAMLMGIVVII
jgi:hypothetical protein